MILSQLVDADDLAGLSPDELRAMISRLDDDIVRGWDESVSADSPATEAVTEAEAAPEQAAAPVETDRSNTAS